MGFRIDRFPAVFGAIVAATLHSGCASYRPAPPIPPANLQKQYQADVGSATLIKDYNQLPQTSATDIQAKVARRNQIIQELLWLIDQNYGSFEESYYGSDASVNFWGDTLNLGLTGVSSVTGTAHLKSVLSAIATGTTGIKTSYVKNFYDSQTRTAVVQQMRASRAAALASIEDASHMKASVVATAVSPYSLEQGLADVDSYYNAGTIIGALQSIGQSASATKTKADEAQTDNSKAVQLY